MPAKLESIGPRSADGSLCTAVAKAIILPLWGPRGITCLSLTASGGTNLEEGCRDFVRRKNRGIRKICGGRRLKSQDRFIKSAD